MAETLTIERLGHRGDGIASFNGRAAFVPYALAGETVTAQPWPGQADRWRLRDVITPSAERILPFCDYFGECGGCAIQHWQSEPYRQWKRGLVIETLAQAGIACEVDELIDAHGAGRRRVVIHARRGDDDQIRVGFATSGSHAIVEIEHCPILEPRLSGAFDIARALAKVLSPLHKPLDIQLTATDDGIDADIRGSGPLDTDSIVTLSRLADAHGLARLTRHGEMVTMSVPPKVPMGTAMVTLPPGSFLQATVMGEEVLGAQVAGYCKQAKHVADLFCGVGPFALRLAARSRVTAFDSSAPAIAALTQAVAMTKGLKPITAAPRDLFRRPVYAQELREFDAVVFDPPRQGAEAQVKQLAASRVPLVVAVSCNAATFARDAKILIDGGYRLERVTPVDQFRHTPHVELVAKFIRPKI